MSVVVTGATGFVGASLVAYLKLLNLSVHPLSRDGDVKQAMLGAKTVVHLAARVHVMNEASENPLHEFRLANVKATQTLAMQASLAGVQRFVFVSSVKVNGEQTQPKQPFSEFDVPKPLDDYGLSKYEAEQVLQQVAVETGMEVVIIRPPLVYGPGVKANFAALMHAVMRGWPLPFGSIQNARSLVGLDNLVDFIYCCMTHPAAANQTFLVSDGHDVSSAQLVRELAAAAGGKPNLWSVPQWFLELGAVMVGKRKAVQRLCGSLQVDISKAQTLLGWRPPVSMQEGLKKALSKV
jgi:nucleoside-diphosphate-sugar epimerase